MGQMFFPDENQYRNKTRTYKWRTSYVIVICALLIGGGIYYYYWYYDFVPFDAERLTFIAYHNYYLSDNTKDQKKPVRLYKRAAQLGDVRSMCDLAYCYETGRGTPIDYVEALKWYRLASEKGHQMYECMGRIYKKMGRNEDAIKCFQKNDNWGHN